MIAFWWFERPTTIIPWMILTSIWSIFLAVSGSYVHAAGNRFTVADKKIVEHLVKQWSPLVWLAPGEQFLPLDVNEFLENVHVHHEAMNEFSTKNPIQDQRELENRTDNRVIYTVEKPNNGNRKQRTSNEFNTNNDGFKQIPIGEYSKQSYLVTNSEIDELLYNKSSFLYGRDPSKFEVPIYAVINVCSGSKTDLKKNRRAKKTNEQRHQPSKFQQQFIPISRSDDDVRFSNIPVHIRANKTYYMKVRKKRDMDASQKNDDNNNSSNQEMKNEFMANIADNVKFSLDSLEDSVLENQVDIANSVSKIPSFHVTYWMFYPYSQGKTMCTMSLGPFGQIPIPMIFGMCMGSKRDYGSHVGDWEHMSLYFRGSIHPEAMYVSAHDAGAYYSYNHLTETFEFRSQETRKGILQRPNFPKTVITSSNHPVLFAALGSHGLWTAPGKHRFVRVPRLYDVNGFGMPWYTWKIVDITYENLRSPRSLSPKWFEFKGKWGNPKSKCHPLKRIGLNFCEYTDGPTGIPLKPAHFQCNK